MLKSGLVVVQSYGTEGEAEVAKGVLESSGIDSMIQADTAGRMREHLAQTGHRELSEKLTTSEPRAARLRLRNTKRFVEAGIRDLQSMWTGEGGLVRAEIAKRVEKITLTPEGRA